MKHARHIKLLNKFTAWLMGLMESWFGSERTVVADAAFGQVRAVVALRGKGLYMLCNIKQCHKYFPKSRLKEDTPAFQSNSKCTCLTMKAIAGRWIPHNAGFGFLDIASAILDQIHF